MFHSPSIGPVARRGLARLLLLSAVALSATAQTFTIATDQVNGIYQNGATVHWQVTWTGTSAPPAATYSLKRGGLTAVGSGSLQFTNKVATLDATFDRPDALLLEVDWTSGSTANQVFGGALASPGDIEPAAAEPNDFGTFWQAKLAELAAVPPNPQLVTADSGAGGVSYWKITMDNIRSTHIEGQIARPTTGTKFPALLILQWAGVYALDKSWVTARAAEGWLALNIEPHDLAIDASTDFYAQQTAGPLANYWNIGNDNPDTSYYLRMYLSCYRAVEYLRSRDDWDGHTVVVMGSSQGGQQALMVAGLDPDHVTAALTLVPAACDMLAPDAGRAAGFPNWYYNTTGKDPAKVRSASRYYDPANFGRRINAPVLIAAGLFDTTAPPSSIMAAAGAITAPKELLFLQSGHQDVNGSQTPFNDRCYGAWLPALRQGQAAPVATPAPRPAQSAVASGTGTAQIVNLSTRGIVSTGDNVLIAGFVLAGPHDKKLLILTSGLNLSKRLGVAGAIARPSMSLYHLVNGQNVLVASNNDWQADATAIAALSQQLGAQPLSTSTDPAYGDAGMVVSLAPGVYTVVAAPDAQSANQDGIGLIELYDAVPGDGTRLVNISSRGRVETGARQMIVGLVVGGTGQSRLMVRGVGPGLRAQGVGQYLANPSQSLFQNVSGNQILTATNDDGWNSAQADQADALARQVGAFPLAVRSSDSVLVQLLAPGVYSSIIAPSNATPGVALAEVYDANDN